MNPQALQSSASLLGSAGLAGLFLPGLAQAWQSEPDDARMNAWIQRGLFMYGGVLITMGVLQSFATNSILPLVAAGVAITVVYFWWDSALATDPEEAPGG